MMYKRLALCFPMVLLAGCATVDSGWFSRDVQWQPAPGPDKTMQVNEGLASAFVDPKELGGRWLRVTARTAPGNPDFNIWIQMLDKNVRPYVRVLPTICTVESEARVCRNSAWVDPSADRVRIALASFGRPTAVSEVLVEVGTNLAPPPSTTRSFEAVSKEIRSIYYRREEADWTMADESARLALSAPKDIDPVPEAVALLLAHLPESRHSSIALAAPIHGNSGPARLPACTALPDGAFRLDLPGTGGTSSEDYIANAHRCLAKAATAHWLINLTEDNGGDSFVQFGALQPIFGLGNQMEMRGAGGGVFPLGLSADAATLAGRPLARWTPAAFAIPATNVTFVSGPGCASACEAVLIAAKGRFHVIGQPSAGFTTSNEGVAINKQFVANVTSGYMTKLGGAYSLRIDPDVALDDGQTQNALQTGAY